MTTVLVRSTHSLLVRAQQQVHQRQQQQPSVTPTAAPTLASPPPSPPPYDSTQLPAVAEAPMLWWSDALAQVEPDWQQLRSKRMETLKKDEVNMDVTKRSSRKNYDELFSEVKLSLNSGFAQELIVGRAAMLGFLAAMNTEIESGQSLWQQLSYRGMLSFSFVIAVVAIASLATCFRERRERDPHTTFGPFTANAERLNGQAAMVGFVLLLAVESAKGSALF